MDDSILRSIKKLLGGCPDDDHFNEDILIHINSAFFALYQLGLGNTPFAITGEAETWGDFLGGNYNFELVKTYIYLKVKMVFDPPSSSFVLSSMERMISEYEWRLNVQAEGGKNQNGE